MITTNKDYVRLEDRRRPRSRSEVRNLESIGCPSGVILNWIGQYNVSEPVIGRNRIIIGRIAPLA
jgi:hypothetical protein